MKKIIQLTLMAIFFTSHSTLIKSAEQAPAALDVEIDSQTVRIECEQIASHLGEQLRIAVERNDLEKTSELLLTPGIDVNYQAHNKSTALHEAVRRDHTEIAELLLDNGAAVNIQANWNTSTPLRVAAWAGRAARWAAAPPP